MKKVILYIFSTLFSYLSYSQLIENDTLDFKGGWPVEGATWYYLNTGFDTTVKYIKVNYYKDFLYTDSNYYGSVHTVKLRSLLFQYLDNDQNVVFDSVFYFYINDHPNNPKITDYFDGSIAVYIYEKGKYVSKGLYNFVNQPEDFSWPIPVVTQVFKIYARFSMSDTGTIIINSNKLFKCKYNAIDPCFSWGDMVIKNIGSTEYFFPLDNCTLYPIGGPLICYKDSKIGLFKTGIDCPCFIENQEFDLVNIYPNPVKDHLIILSKNRDEMFSYSIASSNGQTIISKKNINSDFENVNLNYLSPGIYFLKYEQGNKIKYLKLIKL